MSANNGEKDQEKLFSVDPNWKQTWRGMPDYEQQNLLPWQSIKVHFRNRDDRERFFKLIAQRDTATKKSFWFPEVKVEEAISKRWVVTDETVNPKYPVYVISKGRWESRLTSKSLEQMKVPYFIVIEPQEYDLYSKVIAPEKILQLPFSDLGQGSIPARNWVWAHALSRGAERHWILDDNIDGFGRLHDNMKIKAATGAVFRAIEDFVDRYENVGMAGMHYDYFANRKTELPPYYLNTRVYSCILLRNDLEFRWRGRYNEDTDLSLQILKSGLCTVLFNAFLAYKCPTLMMKGGNSDVLYKGDGRLKMAESLKEQHPDVVSVVRKYGRWQHHVNYAPFRKNKLILKSDVVIPETNNYGMELKTMSEIKTTEEPTTKKLFFDTSQIEFFFEYVRKNCFDKIEPETAIESVGRASTFMLRSLELAEEEFRELKKTFAIEAKKPEAEPPKLEPEVAVVPIVEETKPVESPKDGKVGESLSLF